MAPPLVWRDSGLSLACHAAGLRFQESFGVPQKWLRQPGGMFHRGSVHETKITESLNAMTHHRVYDSATGAVLGQNGRRRRAGTQ
jgi:hypothetical protein